MVRKEIVMIIFFICMFSSCINRESLLTGNDVKYWHQTDCCAIISFSKDKKIHKCENIYYNCITYVPFSITQPLNDYSVKGRLITEYRYDEKGKRSVVDSLLILRLSRKRLTLFSKSEGKTIELTSDFEFTPIDLDSENIRSIDSIMLVKTAKFLKCKEKINIIIYNECFRKIDFFPNINFNYINSDSIYKHKGEIFFEIMSPIYYKGKYYSTCCLSILKHNEEEHGVLDYFIKGYWKFCFKRKKNGELKLIRYEQYI